MILPVYAKVDNNYTMLNVYDVVLRVRWVNRYNQLTNYLTNQKRAKAEVRSIGGVIPYYKAVNSCRILLRIETSALVLLTSSSSVRLQSEVTPRCIEWVETVLNLFSILRDI